MNDILQQIMNMIEHRMHIPMYHQKSAVVHSDSS